MKSNKWFKPTVIVLAFIIIAISVNVIDKKESGEVNHSEVSENRENDDKNEESGFHIGIEHIVMLVIFVSAYGIDRAIVYKNKLEDDKKYDNNKED